MDDQYSKRPAPRSTAWLLVIVVALLVGGTGGVVAGAATSRPGELAAPPEPPAEFPDGATAQFYLPDVTVAAIEEWAADEEGYECERPTDEGFGSSPLGAKYWRQCSRPMSFGSARVLVETEHNSDAEVLAVHATCERGARTPSDFCTKVFRRAVRTVFAHHPDARKEAVTWAADNIQNDAVTAIGGMLLRVDLGDHRLTITSAG